MKSLEKSRKVTLDGVSDNELISKKFRQKIGNRKETLHPEHIDSDTIIVELDQLLGDEPEVVQPKADVKEDSVDDRKLALLKKFGLFTEQEAGKTTVHSSLNDKERANKLKSDIERSLKELEETREKLADLFGG